MNKSKEKRLKEILEKGKQTAKEGKSMEPIPYESLEFRNAWLIGWRNGGGNVLTGKVAKNA